MFQLLPETFFFWKNVTRKRNVGGGGEEEWRIRNEEEGGGGMEEEEDGGGLSPPTNRKLPFYTVHNLGEGTFRTHTQVLQLIDWISLEADAVNIFYKALLSGNALYLGVGKNKLLHFI